MAIRPELLVRGLDGRPQPPADILARIRRQDARLGLFYTNASWAITEAWRDDDVRRAWVQDGLVQPEMAFDVCGYLPMTCAVEEAPAYIARELRSYKPEEWRSLREAVAQWNVEGHDAAGEDDMMAKVDESLTKSGPSIGVFHVPVRLVDNSVDNTDPAITAAMARARRRKSG